MQYLTFKETLGSLLRIFWRTVCNFLFSSRTVIEVWKIKKKMISSRFWTSHISTPLHFILISPTFIIFHRLLPSYTGTGWVLINDGSWFRSNHRDISTKIFFNISGRIQPQLSKSTCRKQPVEDSPNFTCQFVCWFVA